MTTYQKLGEKERKLLLLALDFDVEGLRCLYCKEKISYKDCAIMQPLIKDSNAALLCNSPMCFILYFDKEEWEASHNDE